jgi:hypothetical protein
MGAYHENIFVTICGSILRLKSFCKCVRILENVSLISDDISVFGFIYTSLAPMNKYDAAVPNHLWRLFHLIILKIFMLKTHLSKLYFSISYCTVVPNMNVRKTIVNIFPATKGCQLHESCTIRNLLCPSQVVLFKKRAACNKQNLRDPLQYS